MSTVVKLKAADGSPVEFVDAPPKQGGMKDVYFSPDRSYVVAFYRKPQDANAKDRLQNIVGRYRENIFNQSGGAYWQDLYCWPTHIVEHKGLLGIKAPFYAPNFFFKHGSANGDMLGIRGHEKEGKWFSTGTNLQKYLAPEERGTWIGYLKVCLRIARAVRRLHAAGLAHSDLSYKNVLIDPLTGGAAVIDIDSLVVPGKYPPDVVGTPDFIAPEVIGTMHLPLLDKGRALPRIDTDRHALAVLIYMYLLYRHPLKGGLVHPAQTEEERVNLEMGRKALFVEHPTDLRNRPNLKDARKSDLPFADVSALPHSIAGPHLQKLFDRAFITGLHQPDQRPSADEWEHALIRTVDLLQPCANPACSHQWHVFANTAKPVCPICRTASHGQLPMLDLYSKRGGSFKPDDHRLMIYTNQSLFEWHTDRLVGNNERLTAEQKKPVGYFTFHRGKWMFTNQRLATMKDCTHQPAVPVPINTAIELIDGQQLLFADTDHGRLARVQLLNT
jgi:serine/threonine protein kinase